jgi:hypothetical protein
VNILPCRIYPYSSCRRFKQSSEATNKVSRIQLRGQHLGGSPRFRGPHLWGPHPAQGYHTKAPDHNHDLVPNSHLRCGAHLLLSPHLNGQSRAHTLGGEKKHKKSVSSKVRDQKTVHNQWTRTIAIGLNTLQRLYNCTRPNRTGTGRHLFQAPPYG